ncbi:MAG: CPBP family intramembrane metalloprotease [Chloroflexaceae bacterium]|jgi:membrane protease YdiL (CAAX protease family)|nr:CPBP family intramembrane metalloprotease [Chloroflexaceae bacterium]
MYTESSPPPESRSRLALPNWQIGAGLGALAVVFVLGLALGGEARSIASAGLQVLPFMVLAVLAYLGSERGWAKILALIWLVLLLGGMGLLAFGYGFAALLNGLPTEANPLPFVEGAPVRLLLILLLTGLAGLVGLLGLVPAVRRALSRFIPIDPDSFVHAVALVAVVGLTLISFVPLLVLGAPPLLSVINNLTAGDLDLTGGRGDAGMLRDLLYGLMWLVPCAIIAVGLGVRRSFSEALERLGLVRPTLKQVLAALGLAVLLVLAVSLLTQGINWLWGLLGWPTTDTEAFGQLLGFAMSGVGALVVGVTAGLGEELAVRGALQPRMGILLSNLFFTSLHAYQYSWDALLIVFLVGTACGLVRKYSNTTTAAIVHGTYNFLLIMLSVLAVPWFSS